jgi:hypothetical protein
MTGLINVDDYDDKNSLHALYEYDYIVEDFINGEDTREEIINTLINMYQHSDNAKLYYPDDTNYSKDAINRAIASSFRDFQSRNLPNDVKYNKAYYKYVIDNMESVKNCIEFIISLQITEMSYIVKIALLDKEICKSIDNIERSTKISEITASMDIVHKCVDIINAYTNHVMKAVASIESLKCEIYD